jgi:sec-independent protein translocase protein TatA
VPASHNNRKAKQMLGLDNPIHILFLLVLLLLVFGAKRLPELGRSLGSGMRGFKETLSGEQPRAELVPAARPQPEGAAEPLTAHSQRTDTRAPSA